MIINLTRATDNEYPKTSKFFAGWVEIFAIIEALAGTLKSSAFQGGNGAREPRL
jgi:hypothetical protein